MVQRAFHQDEFFLGIMQDMLSITQKSGLALVSLLNLLRQTGGDLLLLNEDRQLSMRVALNRLIREEVSQEILSQIMRDKALESAIQALTEEAATKENIEKKMRDYLEQIHAELERRAFELSQMKEYSDLKIDFLKTFKNVKEACDDWLNSFDKPDSAAQAVVAKIAAQVGLPNDLVKEVIVGEQLAVFRQIQLQKMAAVSQSIALQDTLESQEQQAARLAKQERFKSDVLGGDKPGRANLVQQLNDMRLRVMVIQAWQSKDEPEERNLLPSEIKAAQRLGSLAAQEALAAKNCIDNIHKFYEEECNCSEALGLQKERVVNVLGQAQKAMQIFKAAALQVAPQVTSQHDMESPRRSEEVPMVSEELRQGHTPPRPS